MAICESLACVGGGALNSHILCSNINNKNVVMKYIIPPFEKIFSLENLFKAWQDFKKGKKNKKDVADFSLHLVHNLSVLRNDIISGQYKHSGYLHFKINDPKPRDIHKASVRDRVVHHCLYSALYPHFDQKFIFDSYSCRLGKGTHKALSRFKQFSKEESGNCKRKIWILKCDIRKCFASVDHIVLKSILKEHIMCGKLFVVIESVIDSFSSGIPNKGIPLGNLTSQLFINIYLHELDLYLKHRIKAKKYIRYADDFVIFSKNRNFLLSIITDIQEFLHIKLKSDLHNKKLLLKSLFSGFDFLGWIHFPNHKVLRTNTKKRMFKKLAHSTNPKTLTSYLGFLKHGNTNKIKKMLI